MLVLKVNRKVHGVPESKAAANPWYQGEAVKDRLERVQNKQTNAWEAQLALSSPNEVITMQNHENKEQGKTQQETSHSKNKKPHKINPTPGPPPQNGR